jgi:hypothetical protein
VVVPSLMAGALADELEQGLRNPVDPAGSTTDPGATTDPGPDGDPAGRAGGGEDDGGYDTGSVDDLDTRTVVRRDAPPPPQLPPPPAPAAPPVGDVVTLRFDAGTIVVRPGEQVVLGRDPSPTGSARSEVVPGDASTVSKSHVLVTFDGTAATVQDLASTNGTAVISDGTRRAVEPGDDEPVSSGDLLELGVVTCVVQIGPAE